VKLCGKSSGVSNNEMPPVVNPAALEKKLLAKSSISCPVSYGET
jgi:hypothetical protein